jgi:hypothetical protein
MTVTDARDLGAALGVPAQWLGEGWGGTDRRLTRCGGAGSAEQAAPRKRPGQAASRRSRPGSRTPPPLIWCRCKRPAPQDPFAGSVDREENASSRDVTFDGVSPLVCPLVQSVLTAVAVVNTVAVLGTSLRECRDLSPSSCLAS